MALKRISDYDPIADALAGTEMLEVETADNLAKHVTAQQIADLAGAGSIADGSITKAKLAAGVRTQCIPVACSDETTALTAGNAKVTFRMPYALTLSAVRASLTTAQTSGSIFTVNVKKNGTTVFSTKVTIDNTEKTSTTAATAAVLSTTALADDDEITIDIDQVGDGTAKGLKVYLVGEPT